MIESPLQFPHGCGNIAREKDEVFSGRQQAFPHSLRCKVSSKLHSELSGGQRRKSYNPYDDHILELAVAASADFIITFNTKDFDGTEKFGIRVIEPDKFLNIIGEEI